MPLKVLVKVVAVLDIVSSFNEMFVELVSKVTQCLGSSQVLLNMWMGTIVVACFSCSRSFF